MIIEHNISAYCVRSDESILAALSRMDTTHKGFVVCVDEAGVLEGVLTDGDIRRWLMQQDQVDLRKKAGAIVRRDCDFAYITEPSSDVSRRLSDRVRFIPLVDERRRLVALGRKRGLLEGVVIGSRVISDDNPVFVIAEIGINHNGSEEAARRLVDVSRDAGADCVKFQMRQLDVLYRKSQNGQMTNEDLGAQYTMNLLNRFELPVDTMIRLFDYARSAGLIPLCTPWEEESLRILEEYGMAAYKVASADLTNHSLLTAMSRTYKPLIVSTGMSSEEEIVEAIHLLRETGVAYVLLHCNSAYPPPFKDINLNYLPRLRELGGCPVGYSGHERGVNVAIAAVAKGARVIEKHITLDRAMEGSDHKVSLLPDEFKTMVEGIRQVDESLGTSQHRTLTQGELMNRTSLAKSLVAACEIPAGRVIEDRMIAVRSPGRGLQPNRRMALVGRVATRSMAPGDFFFPSDLTQPMAVARQYNFSRPWGVTVRWHDFRTILEKARPDFVEFHLSFKDMDEDYRKYFNTKFNLTFKVHSPDTFENDHLLDLSNPDPAHRRRSVSELQRVINLTRDLIQFFEIKDRPVIIVSLGGFSADGFLSIDEVKDRYSILAESMHGLDSEGVEILGQTLPPFPWYFGGQMFLNLFVKPEDTAEFCRNNKLRLCFDISHSKLACNHYKISFKEFVDTVGPYAAHLHVADARGVDGEGLQVGSGEIDFRALCEQLKRVCPKASFMPEIWQGHKNEGEGFWLALERLEKMGL